MKILCLVDTANKPGDRWLWKYLPSNDDEVDFLSTLEVVDRFQKWGKLISYYPAYWRLGIRTLYRTLRNHYDLVVAWEGKNGFPYAVLRSMIGQKHPPLLILAFNIRGPISHFLSLARFGMRSVTRTVVFSAVEVERYQRILSLAPEAISFCPQGWYDPLVWYDPHLVQMPEAITQAGKFILASGRSYRDYTTLARAINDLDVKVMVSARKFNLAGFDFPNNMQSLGWLPQREFLDFMYHCQFYIIPLQKISHAGGDSSLIQAMSFGKAVVATRAPSTETYIEQGVTGLLVSPGNVAEMREAILYLWKNPQEAARMGQEARRRYKDYYTIEKFAQRVYTIVLEIYHAHLEKGPVGK
jgi:glycosyltransferase involved in cell wall biosynthesis